MKPRPVQQSEDGTAHLAYYDKEKALSYVWDGKTSKIEVSSGGYAEPVIDMIDAPRLFSRSDRRAGNKANYTNEFIDVVNAFAIICQLDADNRLPYAERKDN